MQTLNCLPRESIRPVHPVVIGFSNWFQAVADTQPSTQFMALYYVCMRVYVCVCMFLCSSDGKAIKLTKIMMI